MDLSIIIVSWNVKEKLRENLSELFKSIGDAGFEVFVVDNASSDGSAEMVKNEFPQAKLIENNDNLGFGKANNQAIKEAKGNFILFLNPDMRVLPDTIKNMHAWMEANPQAAVAGCRLVDEQGRTVDHVRKFPNLFDQLMITLKIPHVIPNILDDYLLPKFDYEKAQKVDSIRGAFFMINRSAIENIKQGREGLTIPFFDERYFIWFEEVDYCKQIRQAGGEVWFTPAAECVDYVGQSFSRLTTAKKQSYIRESMLKYFKKWHPAIEYYILLASWPFGILIAQLFARMNIAGRAKT
jgi:GT2 family glycosyltransferase